MVRYKQLSDMITDAVESDTYKYCLDKQRDLMEEIPAGNTSQMALTLALMSASASAITCVWMTKDGLADQLNENDPAMPSASFVASTAEPPAAVMSTS